MMTASVEKLNLLGMPKTELETFFAGLGEKPYRARQILKWIYQRGVSDIDAMTDLSKSLRTTLTEAACVSPPIEEARQDSVDGIRCPEETAQGGAVGREGSD